MSDTKTTTPSEVQHSVLSALHGLRARASDGCAPEQIIGVLDRVAGDVRGLLAEHGGMADELLVLYEQLGIVFEVTRRLPEVRDENEVLSLFVASLGRTFGRCLVSTAAPDGLGLWSVGEMPDSAHEWLGDLLDASRAARAARVATPPPGAMPEGTAEVLVGPLFCGDAFVCAVVMQRRCDTREFQASEMLLVDSLLTFCGDLIRNHRLMHELRELSVSSVRALVSAVDQKDPYTFGHSVRVGYYATQLGTRIGLKGEDLQMVQWSALLHDVGKIGIRDDVLKKDGKLTPEEFEHMKEHPVRSHQVVSQIPPLHKALDGALHHHEKWSGKGYPHGLAGEAIPLQARVIQLADIFDALTSNRSYRAAFDWTRALSIIAEESGTTVDPNLQPIFDVLMRELIGDGPDGFVNLTRTGNCFARDAGSLVPPGEGDAR